MATNIPLTGKFKVTCEYKRKGSWAAGWHTGIDLISLDNNDTIYNTCDGVVSRIGRNDKNYGNFIVVKDNATGKYHWFCHLSRIDVSQNQKVDRVSRIGVMGNTGNSTAKHLHYEIRNQSNSYADNSNPAEYMKISNQVGEYNSANYQIKDEIRQDNFSGIKVFACNTNIRENPSLNGIAHLYKANTTVEILESNVSNADGYIWDKVVAKATNRIGYVARTSNRYK